MNGFRHGLRGRCALLKNENGFIATLAVVIMSAMMLGGLALLALNKRNSESLVRDRQTQTAYSIAEAGLNNQIKLLSTSWPSSAATKEPSVCTQVSTAVDCPDPATLYANFADTLGAYLNATWTISVRDDVAALANDFQLGDMDTATDATCGAAPCTWDSNRNGTLWVVAQAVLQDPTCVARQAANPSGPTGASAGCARKRTLLAQAEVNTIVVPAPYNSVTAGSFGTGDNGNKIIVNTKGLAATAAPISVRCTTNRPGTTGDPCLGYDSRKNQVSPNSFRMGQSYDPLVSPIQLDMLRSAAQVYGTYYTTCPPTMTGAVVFVELTDFTTCPYPGNDTYNSAASPGSFIISNGYLSMSGNTRFYGLIYALNDHVPKNETVITLTGNATVQGAVLCESNCKVSIGQTANALMFDPAALTSFKGVQNVAMGPNTFRDIPN